MGITITSGTILIAEKAILPEYMYIESEPFVHGWRLLNKLDSRAFGQILREAGWGFFFIPGAIESNVFGSDEKRTALKAIKRILAGLKSTNYNCLEITNVTMNRSVSGVPYVNVSANSRHIQKDSVLKETAGDFRLSP